MFKLLIECSKDLESLNINFTDGTSIIKECISATSNIKSTKDTKNTSNTSNTVKNTAEALDLSVYDSVQSQEILKLPIIEDLNRPISVASELQNLDV